MKSIYLPVFLSAILLFGCNQTHTGSKSEDLTPELIAASRITEARPVSVMLTCYSTTLLANGHDSTKVRIAITDSLGREITSARDTIHIYVTGRGRITYPDGSTLPTGTDTSGATYGICSLPDGICNLLFIAGETPDKVKVEARSGKLWPGAHEIHTLSADFVNMKPAPDQVIPTTKTINRMIGADISFLPQIEEEWNRKFYENGQEIDAIKLLHEHGMNWIRLRIFVNPENEKGYSPAKGYCGLKYTLYMARRVKDAGMNLLLDFHYSDYWADPQQQNKPLAWDGPDFETLKDSLKTYTTRVLLDLKQQGTLPDMVQIGNEINHGILWPDGHISHPDQLAALLKAGTEGVRAADPKIPVMMHIALGGQNQEARFWLDNMIVRGVQFDIIGLSYYPRWHGTLTDLYNNLKDLVLRYKKPVDVVEYSDFKKQVHEIVFSIPDEMGKGACIWEPLNWRSGLFDKDGNVTDAIPIYDTLNAKYLK